MQSSILIESRHGIALISILSKSEGLGKWILFLNYRFFYEIDYRNTLPDSLVADPEAGIKRFIPNFYN